MTSSDDHPTANEYIDALEREFQKVDRRNSMREMIRSFWLMIKIRLLKLSARNRLVSTRRITVLFSKEIFRKGRVTEKFVDQFFHHMERMKAKNSQQEFLDHIDSFR
ncbi:MAG: hypothetical protein AAFQ94_28320 [Bacteroidota bacterium]